MESGKVASYPHSYLVYMWMNLVWTYAVSRVAVT